MKAVVFYATREGQARRVAERVAADLRARQTGVDVLNVKNLQPGIDWTPYDFACDRIGARRPARARNGPLRHQGSERAPAGGRSLPLADAVGGRRRGSAKPRELREQSRADVQRMIDVFDRRDRGGPSGFCLSPERWPTAYNVFIRFVMKRIARKAGAPTHLARLRVHRTGRRSIGSWTSLSRIRRHRAFLQSSPEPDFFVDGIATRPRCSKEIRRWPQSKSRITSRRRSKVFRFSDVDTRPHMSRASNGSTC